MFEFSSAYHAPLEVKGIIYALIVLTNKFIKSFFHNMGFEISTENIRNLYQRIVNDEKF